MSIKLGSSASIQFYSGSYTGEGIYTADKLMAKWEIDPDDETSFQLRVPSSSFGGNNDRIAFYISGSGKIGIGTKDPESAFDVRDVGEDVNDVGTRRVKLQALDRVSTKSKQNITGDVSASGFVYGVTGSFDNFDGGVF